MTICCYFYTYLTMLSMANIFAHTSDLSAKFIDCITIKAQSPEVYPKVSKAKCPSTYSLVGCNIIGDESSLFGSYIENNICKSSGGYPSKQDDFDTPDNVTGGFPATAVARCCKLPKCVTCNSITRSGDGLSIVYTPHNSTLTGCTAYSNNITAAGALRVGAAGHDAYYTGFASTEDINIDTYTNTNNTCTASGYERNTGSNYLKASATYCTVPSNYDIELQCFAVWKYVNNIGFSCPDEHFMTSCVARNKYENANDYWYVNDDGQCQTEMDTYAYKFAQAICCQLRSRSQDHHCVPKSNSSATSTLDYYDGYYDNYYDSTDESPVAGNQEKTILIAFFVTFVCCSGFVLCLLYFVKRQQKQNERLLSEYNSRIDNGYAELVNVEKVYEIHHSREGIAMAERNQKVISANNKDEDEDDDIYKYSAPTQNNNGLKEGDLTTETLTTNGDIIENDLKEDDDKESEIDVNQ